MKKIILLVLLLLLAGALYSQDCPDTPCGYCNCEEVEGEDPLPTPINACYYIIPLAALGVCVGLIYTKYRRK